ncbi:hypothetical protein [Spirosoma rhododendri]|uniref:Uncharacterized protein n=1 Tax=Spirosoma rhododendri TaxID=2728024 RepID=A0A7L5DPT7_9BACT|nr:hypothetical protein [Spirosoma rhododendri]QJD80449.1 hypothetical protein HH216_19980 [Spirosoma rhododendri]
MKTSELTISEQALTFARTVPGKPVFLVLRVATNESDTQITASTSLPDVFQLATDKRPIFGSAVTLVPEPAGTYIHIRYQPARSGVHEGELLLQSPTSTQTVTLTGRCTRLATDDTRTNKALTRTVGPARSKTAFGRLGATVAGLAVAIGLLYTGITYRCQLAPSLCREEPVVGQQAELVAPVVEAPVAAAPVVDVARETRTTPAKSVPAPVRQQSEDPATAQAPRPVTRRSQSVAASESKEAATAGTSAPGRSERAAEAKVERTVKRQAELPRPVKPATEESDLERELNGRSNQDVPL